MSDAPRDPSQIVAIVGMAGRFPGADTVEQYWSNLCQGIGSISRFSAPELEAAGVPPELRSHPRYVGARAVLDEVESFDAGLFGFSPREAELMDPQLRIFLECAWEALERAGCDPERYGKPIGVYAGVSMNTYLIHQLMRNPVALHNAVQLRILNDKDFLTTWLSYRLNLRGPSMAVQTACSTSLVAVHVACQSLLAFECDAALAGGVTVFVPQERGYLFEEGSIFSPDGHCRPFDAAARGTVGGNGVGLVLLKRLEDALADGDPIHALIRGTAINNDGSLKVSYTAPSVDSQAEVIAAAQSLADVEPDTIGFIETHGTGTALGDPIEIAALTRVFRESTERKGFCALGSVKANIGHLDQAAGVAGLIKASLVVEHGLIPPSLHFEAPNPEIDLAGSPFRIETRLAEWRSNGHPRRAGVSSFGIGGTNAHVVIEQPPRREPSGPSQERQLLLWSARTPTALDAMTRNLGDWLSAAAAREPADRPALADVAWTCQVGRRELAYRRALVCSSLEDAAAALSGHRADRLLTGHSEQGGRSVAFLFPGQGSQYPDMGLELYRSERVFREAVDRCCELLAPRLGFDLRQILYPGLSGESPDPGRLAQTAVAQPALFTVEYALARLWMMWGIEPKAMIGHSLGEYVAACLAGVFSLEDALALVAVRGRLIQGLAPGAMLSVALPEAELAPRLGGRLSLAAVNGPCLCAVSGPEEEVEALRRSLEELGIESRRLQTSHAFHSAMMDPILAAFTREVERVALRAPEVPFVSNLTGTWITDAEATDPGYWVRHLRQPVRFAEGAATLLRELDAALLEVGPGRTLATFVRAQAEAGAGPRAGATSRIVVTSLRHARDAAPDLDHVLAALGRLWLAGVRVDWQGFHAGETRRREILPTYPFDRKRYWVDAAGETAPAAVVAEPAAEPAGYDRPAVTTAYEPPRDEEERAIAAIWTELLGIRDIGVHDDFFELGGHSLVATRVLSRMRDHLAVALPLASLFEAPTVAKLRERIREPHPETGPAIAAPPIVPVPRDGALPLSFAQQRFWFLDHLEPGSSWYNLSWALRLDGELNGAALAASLGEIVNRHEALRTTFPEVDGQPVQRIAPPEPVPLPVVDLALLPPGLRGSELACRIAEDSSRPFDLAGGPVLRATLVRLSGSEHVLIFTIHHIVADGWSIGVLVGELTALYSGLVSGARPVLPLLPVQCADHAAWQRSWLQGEVLDRLVEAWRARLTGAHMALDLPSDRPRPTIPSFQGESLRVEMSPRTVESLRALSRGHGATLFMVLLAAVQTLLHRLSGQEDLIVGSPVAGRSRPEFERLIGAFVNTLALRGDLTGRPSFRAVLARTRETALEAYALQDLPFEKLVEALQPERDLSRAPLFQTMLVLQNAPFSRCALPRLELRSLPVESRTSRFDLLLSLAAAGDQIAGSCEIATDLFDRSTVQRWLAYLETLIAGAADQPDLPVAALPMVSEAEQAQLLREWNDTELGIRCEATLHELFTAQVERSPEAVALVFRGASLTYRELDARANRLAHRLRHLGVGPEVIVGVFCERSPEMVVALLAILKAGGAYLPLSPEQPEERLSLLVGETAAPVLLTQERLAYRLPAYGGIRIFVDHDAPGEQPESAPDSGASAGNLAYVIYTSGSTGRPKGVAIEHRSAAALVAWAAEVFPAEDLAGVLASTAIYFDLSVFELFVTLSRGGRVFLVENVLELATLDAGGALTLVNTVPSGIAEVLRLGALPASVRTVNLAGEPLKSPLVRQLHGLGSVRQVFNLYGPSEDTTYSTFARIDSEDGHPPIGVPVADTRVRLLDRGLSQVPVGAVGEIYLSGAGLARGYFGQPGLTAERFVPDPFSDRPGDRMYRTGDLARYRTSGLLDYLGRVDHQVKLRGFRIELGEIEAVLQRHPRVREAVVVVRRDHEDDPRLAAYVVPDQAAPEPALVDELRQHLQDRLPSYMIPAAFVLLEALPLTPNGKIDRKVLLELAEDRVGPEAAHQPPRSELEIRMAEVWKELLGLDRIGVQDRLFDLGAHSLLMVRAHVKLRDLVGDRLTLVDLFKYPTIASLASFLDAAPGQEVLQLQRGRERSERRGSALGDASRDVAVVGLRGRFSQAQDLGSFWQNLCDGVEAISFFSDEELSARGVDPARLKDPVYVKAGGVLEDFERFDAAFFGYSPREAEIMDPQQRLFLECSWEALEDAGYDPDRYPGAVGVFAGTSMSWYLLNIFSNPDLLASQGLYQAMIGNDKDFLPTRVSYKLNLRGPSVNVQSACSTSLVAVHFACQSLLNGECDMALAGGVSASAAQGVGYTYSEGGIFSPDGHCRAFDAGARGTVSGSGLAVVVLKRLADAIADGDTIRAVIKGSAINNDGSFKVGYTAPSVEGQANVITEAQAIAGVDPETITYVETHGTGTEVGDPIEVQALTAAWRQKTDCKGFCAIGSVKTNLGHLDAAAGVTGLVKTVLALEAKKIPPSLHFEQPNPKLDLANSPFYVSDRLTDWVSENGPRRAGVSSFGLGGTNAHVVLEEAPEREPSSPSRPLQLLVLSTRSGQGIEAATDNLAEHLRRHPGVALADAAYTLQVGRAQLDHRRILVCRDREDAVQALETRDPQRLLTLVREAVDRQVTFLFPGGGAQHADMGLELYREEPVFREEVDRCLELAAPHVGLDLKPYLYPSLLDGAPGGALSRTSTALPALFITEIALAKLWMSWGIRPQALIGHSLGEYAAAYLAGVLSLEDALALVALRGRLFETLPEGAMLSVPLPEAEALPLLGERLSIAAINDSTQCVVSGPVEEIALLEQSLIARGLEVHKLHIEVAAHSVLVEPILAEFGDFLRRIRLQAPRIPFVSNVTGTWIRDEEATDPEYWVRQLRQTVRFAAGLDALLEAPHQVFLEMGPGRVLSSFVRRHPRKSAGHEIFTTLRHVKDSVSDQELTLNLLGRLWLLGQEIDWAGFHAGERRHRVPLPTYPFDRQRFWVERRVEAAAAALSLRRAVKKPDVADWFYAPSWRLSAWPAAAAAKEPAVDEPGEWLLFADGCGLGRELADALASQGHRVITVVEGATFVRTEDGTYTLDPAQSADYDALLRDLQRRGGIPRRIVHLWSVTADDPAPVAARFDRAQDRGFHSLLRLAQALLRHNVTADVQLDVVSNGLQRVDGGDAVCPEKATLLGVCQVLPQEYDCFSCRSIDVVLERGRRTELASRLAAEISQPARERAVAYRGRRRWVRSFEPVRVEAPAAGTAPALRERGVYLITGGLGRFGLSYARHLADTVEARLILTGRSGLPPRDAWPQWLDTHGEGDPVSRKIRQVEDLERRGASVVTVSADVADEAQMGGVVELARQRFGGLHGVIHAAGLIGPETFRAIPETGPQEAEAHFRPKLRGAAVLARVLEEVEPDFCLMISSISTVLGGLGFAAYSAANLALDAFAQERDRAGGFPWMSVGWDAWAEREGEAPAGPIGAELAELAMSPQEGLDVFSRCLSLLGAPQLTVSTGDLEARARRWSAQRTDVETPEVEPVALHDRPNLPQPYVAPRDATEGTVAGLWQGLLGIQQIGIHDNFFELGGDSLRATQLASGLRRTFGVSLPLRTLFDAPTVAGQALAVESLQAERTKEDPPVLSTIERGGQDIFDQLAELDDLSDEGIEALLEEGPAMYGGLK